MRLDRVVCDVSLIRGLWEVRVRRCRQIQKEEEERVEKSALPKINQQWQYRIYCKTLKHSDETRLKNYLERSTLTVDTHTHTELQGEDNSLIFRLEGQQWMDFPRELQWTTYLTQWLIRGTRICRLPDWLAHFTQLSVLHMQRNQVAELPAGIGKLGSLRELNLSYNRLSRVPPELGDCVNLESLELAGNRGLAQLPFELSGLKKLVHLDLAQNSFASVPVCVLRMSSLQLLDLSHNTLTDLPEDMDRLQRLQSLFLHQNSLSYLPHCLTAISSLHTVVVSAEPLTCVPSRLCSNPHIKFIRLYNQPLGEERGRGQGKTDRRRGGRGREEEEEEQRDTGDKEFINTYIDCLKDRDSVPYSTTKVSLSCLL